MALLLNPMSGAPEAWRAALHDVLPGLEVRLWPDVGDPADIEFAFVSKMPLGELKRFPQLKLIGSMLAGVDHLVASKDLPPGIPLVRTGAPDGDPMMTEFAILHVLRHHRRVPEYLLAQQREEWAALPQPRTEERRVGLLGLGSLALPVAIALRDLGFQVAAWSRTAKQVDGVKSFHGRGQFADFLARTDILLNLLPLTAETRGIVDAAALAAMPRGAAVINLGRGPHVVVADLIAALDSGHLSAATLDVFDVEPLPAGSPLWKHPRITVMPHVARRQRPVDVAPQIAENVRRVGAGQPLLQVIDLAAGY
jgi:glyoxylate/hydroxypyruvate reductase A